MQKKYYRRPYRAFNHSNTLIEPNYKKTFSKKVSFSNEKYEQKFNKYGPPNHVPKYSNYPIKTKNRFEGLSMDDDVVHHNDEHLCHNNDHQNRSKKNFKSKKSKLRNIVTGEHLSKDMEELTRNMIEKVH